MRYEVWFADCDGHLEFEELNDALKCARLNAGNVYDTETGEIIERHS